MKRIFVILVRKEEKAKPVNILKDEIYQYPKKFISEFKNCGIPGTSL